jgi:hypothetical protein
MMSSLRGVHAKLHGLYFKEENVMPKNNHICLAIIYGLSRRLKTGYTNRGIIGFYTGNISDAIRNALTEGIILKLL